MSAGGRRQEAPVAMRCASLLIPLAVLLLTPLIAPLITALITSLITALITPLIAARLIQRRAARRASAQLSQRIARGLDHAIPVAQRGLPEQPCPRIPRRVVALQQPAPAAIEAIKNPDRPVQRAGQMRCRRVH